MNTENPVKVVHVLLSDRKGGLEQAFVNVSNALVRLGHEVEAWIPETAPYRENLVEGVAVFPFSAKGFYDVRAMFKARWRLKKIKPDLIIAHNSRAASLMARSRTGLPFPLVGFSHSDKLKRMRGVDTLVVLTEKMRQKSLASGFRDKQVVIFPNMMLHVPPLNERRLSRALPVPLKLGFVGRINPEKGLDLLLEAVRILDLQGLELKLHIAGSGDSEMEIRELADRLDVNQCVVFDGWIEDLAGWLKNIDLAVFPSRSESFGIVVLEAAAYGCPVVATKADGPLSQIADGYDGWLAEVDNVQSLADTLQRAIDMYPRWPEIIRHAHVRAQRYSMEALLPELEAIVQGAIASGR